MLYSKEQPNFPPLFAAVGCVCVCNGKLLLLKRIDDKSYPGYWGIPSGKIDKNESALRAMVRELFEETSILLSADNLKKVNTYHIISSDVSFLYTLYVCNFKNSPSVKIRQEEHKKFAWFNPDDALRLELIPDLEGCLRDVFPSLGPNSIQLDLFTGRPSTAITSTQGIEQTATTLSLMPNVAMGEADKRVLFASFGPPCAGKTSILKAMMKEEPHLKIVRDNTALRKSSILRFFLQQTFEEERRSFFFHFQMESLLLRFKYTLGAPSYSLVDETIYTTLAYSRALYSLKWMKDYEYQIFYSHYLTYLQLLPRPAAIIYVDCDVDTLMKRLTKRGEQSRRQHEIYYSAEYVDAMRFAFSDVARELSQDYKLKVIQLNSSKLKTPELVRQCLEVVRSYG